MFAFVGDEEVTMQTTRLIAAHEWVKNAEFAINTDAGDVSLRLNPGGPSPAPSSLLGSGRTMAPLGRDRDGRLASSTG